MKKRDLATLAMIGISAGLIVGGCQRKQSSNKNSSDQRSNHRGKTAEQMSSDMRAFYSSLSPESQKKFMELDAQHKMMAIEMANQSCNGKNSCAGMGGCATQSHSCAGENGCKGQGGPPIKDPNKAVDVQYKNQMQERQQMNQGMKNNDMNHNGNGMNHNGNGGY